MVLKDIYYEGTSEEWEQITIDDKERVTEFGALTAGTPVQEVVSDRLVHIPGNEALRNADIHFRCDLNRK